MHVHLVKNTVRLVLKPNRVRLSSGHEEFWGSLQVVTLLEKLFARARLVLHYIFRVESSQCLHMTGKIIKCEKSGHRHLDWRFLE